MDDDEPMMLVIHLSMDPDSPKWQDVPEEERPKPEDIDEEVFQPVLASGGYVALPETVLAELVELIPGYKDHTFVPISSS